MFKTKPILLFTVLAVLALATFTPIIAPLPTASAQSTCAGQAAYAYDGTNLVAGNANPVGDPNSCALTPTGNRVNIGGTEYDEYNYTYTVNGQAQAYNLYIPAPAAPAAVQPIVPNNSIIPSIDVTPFNAPLLEVPVNRVNFNFFYTPANRTCSSTYACWWLARSIVPVAGVVILLLITCVLAVIFRKMDFYSSHPSAKYGLYGAIVGSVLFGIAMRYNLNSNFIVAGIILYVIGIGILFYNRRESMTGEQDFLKEASLFNVWQKFSEAKHDPDSIQDPNGLAGQATDAGKGFKSREEAADAMNALLRVRMKSNAKRRLLDGSPASINRIPATTLFDGRIAWNKLKPGIDLTLVLISFAYALLAMVFVFGINIFTAAMATGITVLWFKEYGREIINPKKISQNLRRFGGIILVFLLTLALIPHLIVALVVGMITAAWLHPDWIKEGGFDLANSLSLGITTVTMWFLVLLGPNVNPLFIGTNPVFRAVVNLLTS